ncbi:MFS transporter [Conyzicola nivalis]|uniref:Major facilitator transporter n=1 Tax=Conyzicola nivalis TaxID=1477021 RepID=A0A916SA86_9MICO|nr:major facilitator transporter [Conyzicola nivalis]
MIVLAIMSGAAVSVVYLPQTLLTDIAAHFQTTAAVAGITATTIQIGYALGIFFLVPLADRVDPRLQVTIQSLLLVAALAATVFLPSVGAVALGLVVVGLVANVAQVILPAANRLAPPGRAGSTTATLIGSWLAGIFGGRIVAGLLVQVIGWQWVVVVFALALLALLPFARAALGPDPRDRTAHTGYGKLLVSTISLIRRSPTVGESIAMQFLIFATFNSLWTVVVLYLTGDAVGWTATAAGLFGFVGLAVVLCVPVVGRLVDRFGQLRVAGAGLGVALLASVSLIFDHRMLVLYGVSMFLIALSQQATQSAIQSRLLISNPTAPGQANTVFMFSMFVGGAFGAFIGPWGYAHGGLTQVAVQCSVFVAVSLVVWVGVFRRALSKDQHRSPSSTPAS